MATIKNQETDLSSVESVNLENSEKVSKETKKEIQEDTNTNNEEVSEAKPKLIIKIPKPFGLGYWIIDLSKLLGNLLKGLLAAVVAIILAKIAEALTNFIQAKIDKGLDANNLSQSDIDAGLNELNTKALIEESQSEYNKSLLNNNSTIDINIGDGKVTDVYSQANKNKKNISNKNKYSIDRRNRKDILESEVVSERDGSNNRNLKLMKNPNYGVYLD